MEKFLQRFYRFSTKPPAPPANRGEVCKKTEVTHLRDLYFRLSKKPSAFLDSLK